jgi:hypothetical protein
MAPSQNSTAAIVSLAAGIASWTILPFVAGVVAIIAGHMAKKEIRASGNRLGGDGLSTAGLIMGYANVLLSCFGILALLALFGFAASAR